MERRLIIAQEGEEASVNASSSQEAIPSFMPSTFFGLEFCSPPASVSHGKEGTVPPQEGICPQKISSINNSLAFGLQWDPLSAGVPENDEARVTVGLQLDPFAAGVPDDDEASVHTSSSQDNYPPSQNTSTTNLIPSTNNASGIAQASKLSTKEEKRRRDTEEITQNLENLGWGQGGEGSRGTNNGQSRHKRLRRSLYQKL